MPFITRCMCMKIRAGRIPYLNSEPFYFRLDSSEIELHQLVPTALTLALEQGGIDAGPIPVVDYFRLEDRVVPLGQFCIATLEKSRSVLLFSRQPVQEMGGSTVGITDETSTSRRLLEVLLGHRFRVAPAHYVTLEEPNDAFLLIGDEALKRRQGVSSYPYCYDLAEEWHRWTSLPFVFALWVARQDLNREEMTYMENVLYDSLDEGLQHIEHISQMRQDLGMSVQEVEEYFREYRYRAGAEERKALEHFRSYLALPARTRES